MLKNKVLIASYSWSGQTTKVAQQLQKLLPTADRYQIQVASGIFDSDMYKTDAIATSQIKNNDYPELTNPVPNFSDYELILLGSPVWSGRPATPIHSFLTAVQGFQGYIASFYTDAGNAGNYDKTLKEWAKGLKLLPSHEGITNLAEWLQELETTTTDNK